MNAPSLLGPRHSRRWLGGAALMAAALATGVLIRRFAAPAPATQQSAALSAAAGSAAAKVSLGSDQQRGIGITFAPVIRAPLEQVVRSVGIVAFDESRLSTVSSKVEGWVEGLAVDFTGERVSRGQPLLSLYAPEVAAAQQELLLGIRLVDELKNGSEEARRAALELVAASRRKLANWDVPAAEIAALEAGGAPSRTVSLRARASGFAVEKSVQLGQRVMPGEPLYRLADLRVVWVEGEVYERDISLIRVGSRVLASFSALPGVERRGKVDYLYPTVDSDTRTVRVRVVFANADLALRPGMYATLEFESPGGLTLSIPRSAALVTGKRTLVFLKCPDGRFEPREVTLGTATDDRYEVRAGLVLGDTVVASGTFLLDAESNLGTMLGGMGGMPGMDVAPARPAPGAPKPPKPPTHQHQ
jgi:membrane fusion protein, copper/silver efflux system